MKPTAKAAIQVPIQRSRMDLDRITGRRQEAQPLELSDGLRAAGEEEQSEHRQAQHGGANTAQLAGWGREHCHVVHSGPFSPATHVAPFVVHTEESCPPTGAADTSFGVHPNAGTLAVITGVGVAFLRLRSRSSAHWGARRTPANRCQSAMQTAL